MLCSVRHEQQRMQAPPRHWRSLSLSLNRDSNISVSNEQKHIYTVKRYTDIFYSTARSGLSVHSLVASFCSLSHSLYPQSEPHILWMYTRRIELVAKAIEISTFIHVTQHTGSAYCSANSTPYRWCTVRVSAVGSILSRIFEKWKITFSRRKQSTSNVEFSRVSAAARSASINPEIRFVHISLFVFVRSFSGSKKFSRILDPLKILFSVFHTWARFRCSQFERSRWNALCFGFYLA